MSKAKKQQPVQPRVQQDVAPYWAFFFRDQKAPILRSQLITALMAGKQLEVDRLLTPMLLDVVIVSMASRFYHEAEIIDDYQALLQRTDTAWGDPMYTRRTFDQVHSNVASFIVRGSTEFKCFEDQYIPDLVGWYLERPEVPNYFSKEIETPKQLKAARG